MSQNNLSWDVLVFCSDQTDPFNRQPLTMDMVKPEDDLRKRIQEWRNQHLNKQ